MSEIHAIIDAEVKQYEDTTPDANPTFATRVSDIYNLIDHYWVSKFRDGDKDVLGYKKVFYNIVNFPVENNSKMLDLDTKDIQLKAEDWSSYWPSWLMSKELKMWMKDKYFGRQLNEYALNWPKYGHLFVKKADDDVVLIPCQNMIINPIAMNIKNVPIIEKHEYTEDEFYQAADKHGWENLENIEPNDDGLIIVYESYFPKGYLEAKENYFITLKDSGNVLFYAHKDKCPYKELPWERLNGRLFGRGQVEKLFEEQIFMNRIKNYEAQGLHWTSKHIYQTRDTGIASNLMTETKDGDIMILNSELNPVAVEERNLSMYNSAKVEWEENSAKRTFTREPIAGGETKSGITLGATVLQTKMAMSFFEQKKEELGMFIKEILWDWVIPDFKNQKRKEHKVLIKNIIGGDEDNSEKFFKLKLNERMNKIRWNTKSYLSPDQWNIRRGIQAEILKNGDLSIPRSFYDDLKYKIEIIITGESTDTAAKLTTLQTIFQILGSNPTILQDKRVRKVFYKMMDMAGFNPHDLQLEEEPIGIQQAVEQERAQIGGSIASPATPTSAPASMQTQARV